MKESTSCIGNRKAITAKVAKKERCNDTSVVIASGLYMIYTKREKNKACNALYPLHIYKNKREIKDISAARISDAPPPVAITKKEISTEEKRIRNNSGVKESIYILQAISMAILNPESTTI